MTDLSQNLALDAEMTGPKTVTV